MIEEQTVSKPESGKNSEREAGSSAPPCSAFVRRFEAALLRRLDCLREIRELKKEVELLNEAIADIQEEWREADIAEWAGWSLSLPNERRTAYEMYREWEAANPDWQPVGMSIRKRKKS